MFFSMVSERVAIREAPGALRALEATNAVVERFQMPPQCEAGSIHLLAVRVLTAVLLHLAADY
jgi:hypothetical protein